MSCCHFGSSILLFQATGRLFTLVGTAEHRRFLIGLLFSCMLALGLRVSWRKCARGRSLEWIGASLTLLREGLSVEVVVKLQDKLVQELQVAADGFLCEHVISLKRLRSFCGKSSWAATTLPRIRWAVSLLFAVVRRPVRTKRR